MGGRHSRCAPARGFRNRSIPDWRRSVSSSRGHTEQRIKSLSHSLCRLSGVAGTLPANNGCVRATNSAPARVYNRRPDNKGIEAINQPMTLDRRLLGCHLHDDGCGLLLNARSSLWRQAAAAHGKQKLKGLGYLVRRQPIEAGFSLFSRTLPLCAFSRQTPPSSDAWLSDR